MKNKLIYTKGAYIKLEELIKNQLYFSKNFLNLPSASSQFHGSSITSIKGRGIEHAESIPYIQGDDSRYIDWKVSARKQNIYTKVFSQERDKIVNVISDQSISMFFGTKKCFKSTLCANITSLVGWNTIKSNLILRGVIFNHHNMDCFNYINSEKKYLIYLSNLAKYNNSLSIKDIRKDSIKYIKENFNNALSLLINKKNNSLVEIISDFYFWDGSIETKLSVLRKKSNITINLITDSLEKDIFTSYDGKIVFFDGSDYVVMDLSSKDKFNYWVDLFEKRVERIIRFCQKNKIKFNEYNTKEPIKF